MIRRGIFNREGELLGYLAGVHVYDRNDVAIGIVRGNTVYDLDDTRRWQLDGDAVLDVHYNVIGYLGTPAPYDR